MKAMKNLFNCKSKTTAKMQIKWTLKLILREITGNSYKKDGIPKKGNSITCIT